MLVIQRKHLDEIKDAIDFAAHLLKDREGLRVSIGTTPEKLEIVALQALSMLVSMDTGRPDDVHPNDVVQL